MKYGPEIERWVDEILSGERVAGRWLRLCCQRYRDDLKKDWQYYFDADLAEKAISFFPKFLRHTKGEFSRQPFDLSASQKFIVWQLFGWRRKSNGFRRYRKLYCNIGRKWGKSTFAAGLALLVMFADDPIEADAELYSAATKEDQAAIVHSQAAKMILNSPELNAIAKVFSNRDKYKAIQLPHSPYNGSVYKPLGRDSKSIDGLNPHLIVIDELHAFQNTHRELLGKLATGGGSRRQPLEVTITTAGSDASHIWIDQDNYACNILQGTAAGDNVLVFICRLDEARPCSCDSDADCKRCGGTGQIPGDDPYDEANWPKANPEIGITPSWEYLREQAERAQNQKSFECDFLRYHCNLRVTDKRKIIAPEVWAECNSKRNDWQNAAAVAGAFDLGLRNDLAAIVAVARFDDGDEPHFDIRHLSFCPRDGKRNIMEEPWQSWISAGHLKATPGAEVDIAAIKATILEWSDLLGCKTWLFDPWNASQLGQELANNHGLDPVKFTQTYSLYNEPIREFIRVLNKRQISHGGDAFLGWQAGNLIVKEGIRGDWMPDKVNSEDKIDAMCALFMAFRGVAESVKPVRKYWVYEKYNVDGTVRQSV